MGLNAVTIGVNVEKCSFNTVDSVYAKLFRVKQWIEFTRESYTVYTIVTCGSPSLVLFNFERLF